MKNIYLSDFIKMENNEHHKNRDEHRVLRVGRQFLLHHYLMFHILA
jgi:hypothetical protein